MKVVVLQFTMGDVEDPDLWAAEPMWNWQQTDAGKWVMENSSETPVWHRDLDTNTYGYRYKIVAELTEEHTTYYNLKWGIK
jgi:hypothetical protein